MRVSNHAQQRLVERLGTKLTPEKLQQIVSDIHSGKAVYLCQGDIKRKPVYAVLLDGKAIPVVYDKKAKTIITVMHRTSIPQLLGRRLRKLHEDTSNPSSSSNYLSLQLSNTISVDNRS